MTSPSVSVLHGDCIEVLRKLPDAWVDAVVTDPPYNLAFMGKKWDTIDGSFQHWCEEWARECLRVLKPGGHLLAFGGTRTFHRLTAGIEDAGFEIRDSIAWLYGSGFPKSLDVSKAIDKAGGTSPAAQAQVLRAARERVEMTREQVAEAVGCTPSSVRDWEEGRARSSGGTIEHITPSPDYRERLANLLGYTADERSIVGATVDRRGDGTVIGLGHSGTEYGAPATPGAQKWAGWGTALKPSHEPVVVARKPAPILDNLALIGSHLDRLEAQCNATANAAAPSSAPTRQRSAVAKAGSAPAHAATPPVAELAKQTATGQAAGSSDPTATSASESTAATSSSIVTSWRHCWAELSAPTSTSTTATTSETTTVLRTLSSSIASLTATNMLQTDPTNRPGLTSTASAVDALFASAVYASRATRALSAAAPATEPTPHSSPAAAGNYSPIVVARKPLISTVATNVLTYGTGALNIDASRIEGDVPSVPQPVFGVAQGVTDFGAGIGRNGKMSAAPGGRWPANVILDASQAAALDGQSGTGRSPNTYVRSTDALTKGTILGAGIGEKAGQVTHNFGDEGGASRFFRVIDGDPAGFAYVAKAPTKERPKSEDGTAHATVKPLTLMRYLVRLVTQPGGIVLEPFAGSGTTVEACILEGFDVIAIEREAEYLPLIQQRVDRARAAVAEETQAV